MSREPDEILRDALAHFQIMQAYAELDLDDPLVIDAVCMRALGGVEALATLDPTSATGCSAPTGPSCGECATASPTA